MQPGLLAPSTLLHQRYCIEKQVGTGGFGAVYKARDTLFSHRLVAIKEMNQSGLSPRELAEASAAFQHEALFLAGLAHPLSIIWPGLPMAGISPLLARMSPHSSGRASPHALSSPIHTIAKEWHTCFCKA